MKLGGPFGSASRTGTSGVQPEIQNVFAAVDLEWTPEVDERVRTWREENPKGKRGTHDYRLDDYGLDRATVAEAFAGYTERFGIPSEVATG